MAHLTQAMRRGPGLVLATLGGLSLGLTACDGGSSDEGTSTVTVTVGGTDTTNPTSDSATDSSATQTSGGTDDTADTGTEDTLDPSTTGPNTEANCDNPGQGMLDGHVIIESEADVAQIEGIAVVTGEVQVNGTNFEHIDFLVCLEEVGRSVIIYDNDNLVDIEGLKSLTSVGEQCPPPDPNMPVACGNIVIADNDALTDMDGINAIQEVNGSVSISSNPNLEKITGLTSLVVIHDSITIQYNDVLNNLSGFKNLKAVGGNFSVTNNPSLCISKVNIMGERLEQLLGMASTANNDDSC